MLPTTVHEVVVPIVPKLADTALTNPVALKLLTLNVVAVVVLTNE